MRSRRATGTVLYTLPNATSLDADPWLGLGIHAPNLPSRQPEDRVVTYQKNTEIPQRSNMALPLPPGLTPTEVAFLCEMEMVTVVPRQKLESLDLLAVSTPPTPPLRKNIPLTPLKSSC